MSLYRIKRNSRICYLQRRKPCLVLNQAQEEATVSEKWMVIVQMEMDLWLLHLVETQLAVQLQSLWHLVPILGAKILILRKSEGFPLCRWTLLQYQRKIPCLFHLFVALNQSLHLNPRIETSIGMYCNIFFTSTIHILREMFLLDYVKKNMVLL